MVEKFAYLKSINADFVDELFQRYQESPEAVDPSWRYFFEGLELGTSVPGKPEEQRPVEGAHDLSAEAKVADLIHGYRGLGLHLADINPLVPPPRSHPLLELSRFGLAESDLTRTFTAGRLIGLGPSPLSAILGRLREIYCGPVGVEYIHIQNPEEREWLQSRMESTRNRTELDSETREFVLRRLSESEGFEKFLHSRYVAQKRFSLEGGESLIPALDCMIETGALLGAQEFVIGMAHRGRLNVLVNVFGKKPEYVFTEFEGTYTTDRSMGEGDVKYHLGYSSDHTTRQGKSVHLSLASNPSHLEVVDAVIEGVTRAKQAYLGDQERGGVVPIAIHGDAAFAGQGICYETINLSRLPGYATGGTLHIVVNNQVGFTADPAQTRSTSFATDLAKMLEVPIFHVNADHPEAVWHVARLCSEYRARFKKDAFIDLLCYRRHGHNEGDEPSFTQPVVYRTIKSHRTTRDLYAERLASEAVLPAEKAQAMTAEITETFAQAQTVARAESPHPAPSAFVGRWKGLRLGTVEDIFRKVDTAVKADILLKIAEAVSRTPADFHLHSKLGRFLESRARAVRDGAGIDWGNAEALAFGSLLLEGHPVRVSGQDVERGTFTHRHAVLTDFEDGRKHIPLNQLGPKQARLEIYNSHLSEAGVLGFEYGYSLADPNSLVIWEAQFGDFVNSAQVIIDQFISAGESKWLRSSGLVLLLPHGFEGQGSEHSSARLERFLQLAARANFVVANFTTPAQYFHALRRQLAWDFRKPLIVMSPKSLLRHPRAVSSLEDLTRGRFQEVLDDPAMAASESAASARRLLLCSGKVFYDLHLEREGHAKKDVAILRVEQLYPWPAAALGALLKRYPKAKEFVWVQEEPRNMGAWSYVQGVWAGPKPIHYVGREPGAAPAVGSSKLHEKEQMALVAEALELSGEL